MTNLKKFNSWILEKPDLTTEEFGDVLMSDKGRRDIANMLDIMPATHGWAVAEQFRKVMDGKSMEKRNPNALKYVALTLKTRGYGKWDNEAAAIKKYLRLRME